MKRKKFLKGDTIIEVTIAFSVFCLAATLSVSIMNGTLANTEGALELTMARNEIDAQAEALRFIHNSYLTDRELMIGTNANTNQPYRTIWSKLVGSGIDSGLISTTDQVISLADSFNSCEVVENKIKNQKNAFVLNTRSENLANPDTIFTSMAYPSSFVATGLYPRLVFQNSQGDTDRNLYEAEAVALGGAMNQIKSVEGIWIIGTADQNKTSINQKPDFYDFHIYTCWYSPGNDYPTTIGTIIRLYNPELFEKDVGGWT